MQRLRDIILTILGGFQRSHNPSGMAHLGPFRLPGCNPLQQHPVQLFPIKGFGEIVVHIGIDILTSTKTDMLIYKHKLKWNGSVLDVD